MSARHALTILAVSDLTAATRFYSAAFAWDRVVDVPVYVEFALPGGMRLGLYQRESFANNTGHLPAVTAPGSITPTELYFYVEELAAAVTGLRAAGARLLSAPCLRDWGDEAAYLADPDGNVIVVAQAALQVATAAALQTVARRWLQAWQGGDTACIDAVHAVDFLDHCASGRAADSTGFKQGIHDLYVAFPDFYGDADSISVDLETSMVTIIWSAQGTHKNTFLHVPATHKVIEFHGIEVLKMHKHKIVERWGEWDGIDLASQLGALSLA